MPPDRLFDLSQYDLDRLCLSKAEIYEHLPHRYEFQLLDGFCAVDRDARRGVALAEVRSDAWWVRGHVEGRTLLPGVLMLEMAAQASAVLSKLLGGSPGFIAFGGVDGCKFREAVAPPARLYLLCVAIEDRRRRFVYDTQGVCRDKLVFQARVTGLAM